MNLENYIFNGYKLYKFKSLDTDVTFEIVKKFKDGFATKSWIIGEENILIPTNRLFEDELITFIKNLSEEECFELFL